MDHPRISWEEMLDGNALELHSFKLTSCDILVRYQITTLLFVQNAMGVAGVLSFCREPFIAYLGSKAYISAKLIQTSPRTAILLGIKKSRATLA